MEEAFWDYLDSLIHSSEIVIDRPKGSSHPRYPGYLYPLDYGYLEGTSSGDGDGIDLWRGSLPETPLVAIYCTVDLLKRDAELKLLLGCTEQEMAAVVAFHSQGEKMAGILIRRVRDGREAR